MAFDIRTDAQFACNRVAELAAGPDSPGRPAAIAAAQNYIAWCEMASAEILSGTSAQDLDQMRQGWGRAARASGIRAVPYTTVCVVTFVVLAAVGAVAGLVGAWVGAGALFTAALMALGYPAVARPRLVVGPDAPRSKVATLAVRDLL